MSTSTPPRLRYPHLFSPITLGPVTLRHRATMSAHGLGLGEGTLGVSDRLRAYLVERAKGGAAMLATESAPITGSSRTRRRGERGPR